MTLASDDSCVSDKERRELHAAGKKYCPGCEQILLHENFTKRVRSWDGLDIYCRACKSKQNAEHRASWSPERVEQDRARNRYGTVTREERLRNNRVYHLKRHGLTVEQYDEMLQAQGGVCASCRGTDQGGKYTRFCVDHDHSCCPGEFSCGKCVRGLLCITCNVVAGHFESPRAAQVLEYLERTKSVGPH